MQKTYLIFILLLTITSCGNTQEEKKPNSQLEKLEETTTILNTRNMTETQQKRYEHEYTNESKIIDLSLSCECLHEFHLTVYGNGKYTYSGYYNSNNKSHKTKGTLTEIEIESILNKAKEINFIEITQKHIGIGDVHDGSDITYSIWQENSTHRLHIGPGDHTPTKVSKLVNYIFSIVEGDHVYENKNEFKISFITLEHTTPSLGPHEKITTITLLNSKIHSEKIIDFINKSQVNNTTSLSNFLNAKINNEITLLETVYKNAPKGNLDEGENISNLKIGIEGGKTVTLEDVYRRYSLTYFNPYFTGYMVKNGSKSVTSSNPFTVINEEHLPLDIEDKETDPTYSDKDLIIKLQLTPGMPNSDSYQLLVYGNGDFKFKNGFFNLNKHSTYKTNGNLSKHEIKTILNKAEKIDFIGLTSSSKASAHVDDGQQTIFGIWQEGSLRTRAFGYGESSMNEETKALAIYILSLVEN